MQKKTLIKVLLPLLLLALAGITMKTMISSRKAPKKRPRIDRGVLVETVTTGRSNRKIKIHSTGTVQPRRKITLTPQVGGTVSRMSENFIAGGYFEKGATLFEIETVDYQLAVDRAGALLAKQEFELESMESKARIARLEWERLKQDNSPPKNSLVLYEPQLKNARANLISARAALRQAELNLERTRITAPFNCVVLSENVDIGQYLRAGAGVGVIAGTDEAEVVVPVVQADLEWLTAPGRPEKITAVSAAVTLKSGKESFSWQGRIDRLLPEVDPLGRMARLVVRVPDPFMRNTGKKTNRPGLAFGSFVDLELTGRRLDDIFVLPRRALRDNSTVWLMNSQDKLEIRPVIIIRYEPHNIYISQGITEGDRVVITSISGGTAGMKLRGNTQGEQP